MKEVTSILKAMLPVAVGVAAGMILFEQYKKWTA